MKSSKSIKLIISMAMSVLVVGLIIAITELNVNFLIRYVQPDGPIESLSSVFWALSSIFFIVFAFRSNFLKERKCWIIYLFTICWALIAFICAGEEISWGQRIFNISTPESLAKINSQQEINIHNLNFFYKFGGEYRVQSIMILTTGLLLPLIALTKFGKHVVQKYAFPICPIGYSILFFVAWLYGRYYADIFPVAKAGEVREFLWSVGMFLFALHGAIWPCELFRVCKEEKEKS